MAQADVLTLDQERLFTGSLYGKRILAELDAISRELAERNREISALLITEEQALTEKRQTLDAETFRPLADAFDTKVIRLREEQDARIVALQRRRDQERREFTQRVLPVLSDLAIETGAVAILDERAVILSADRIDITDRAITRVNELLGDGGDLSRSGDAVPLEETEEAAPQAPASLAPETFQDDPDAAPGSPMPAIETPTEP
ncbi:OmpH family outer membrane protein [Tropicimonas marinistellae]|uniref:OmpH family outer membrane protein n=1 Tax=Tropicimonas marinistellae TaxID=1739787 RepID=UPI0013731658|nr:OmpH family outer membrane protein [Tropicimonas marinistellae]